MSTLARILATDLAGHHRIAGRPCDCSFVRFILPTLGMCSSYVARINADVSSMREQVKSSPVLSSMMANGLASVGLRARAASIKQGQSVKYANDGFKTFIVAASLPALRYFSGCSGRVPLHLVSNLLAIGKLADVEPRRNMYRAKFHRTRGG